MNEHVILVDLNDNPLGVMPKLDAHIKGVLHRAFSVFIFNSKGEMLIQQRALDKYHSGGLWSNTCCSHPYPGESTDKAAHRRLREEMGMTCHLKPVFNFVYKAELDNRLTEYEFDHVYFGESDVLPELNREEVNNWKYISISELKHHVMRFPSHYTVWLKDCLERVVHFRYEKTATNY